MRGVRTTGRFLKVLAAMALLYVCNASWLAPSLSGSLQLLAHRGVHQDFDRRGLTSDGCTATRIRKPIAPEIESTLASMRAAFELGASVVELDIHPMTDSEFAVFHDWTLDCRTEGTGLTRERSMRYLKTLDIGCG
jgi:glycerophosphoryl diester phosphodiesterase